MKIGILLYDQVTALDAFGPMDILGRVKAWDVQHVACLPGRIDVGNKLFVEPSLILTVETKLDVLLVPGGRGQMEFCKSEDNLRIVKAVCENASFVLTVCTGSLILAFCGLLFEKKVTTNRSAYQALEKFGTIVVDERIVEDSNIISCGGVTAGIDLGFYLVNKIAGPHEAKRIQLLVEYNPSPLYKYASLETDVALNHELTNDSKNMISARDAQIEAHLQKFK